MKIRFFSAFGVASLLLVSVASAAAADSKYRVARKIPLSGEAGWDYLTLDAAARRLYVTRGTSVTVVNPDTGATIGEIPDTPGVHGVALAPALGRGFTSNGRDDSVTIFDLKTLKALGKAKTGGNPDAIIFEPLTKRVFVFNGRTNNATVIDATSGEVTAEFAVGGKPEFAAVDGAGRVFVNVEDTNEVLAIDAKTASVTHRWPLAPGEEPTGMSIDPASHRLFVGCHSKHLIVLDTDTGKVIANPPIGAGVDAVEYDAGTSTVFTSNGTDGTLTVIRQDSPDKYRVVENAETRRSGRTMALDPKTHHVFVIVASYSPAPPATPENPKPRPAILPNSVMLLELAPGS